MVRIGQGITVLVQVTSKKFEVRQRLGLPENIKTKNIRCLEGRNSLKRNQ